MYFNTVCICCNITGTMIIPPAWKIKEETRGYLMTLDSNIYPFEHNFFHNDYVHLKTLILDILLRKIHCHLYNQCHNRPPSTNQTLLHRWQMHDYWEIGRETKSWLKTKWSSLLRSIPLVDTQKCAQNRPHCDWFALLLIE